MSLNPLQGEKQCIQQSQQYQPKIIANNASRKMIKQIILHNSEENSSESDVSGLSFGSVESHDLAVLKFSPECQDQMHALRMEKSIVSYLENLGIIFKTDPRQKEYKQKVVMIQKYSHELIQTLQEFQEVNGIQEMDDFDLNLDLSPQHSVNDGDINDELKDVLKNLTAIPDEHTEPLCLKQNPQTKKLSMNSSLTRLSTSFQNSDMNTRSNQLDQINECWNLKQQIQNDLPI